ncbi:MAG: RnfABCDGE type electron transport complex subunit D [Elusimicrobia bacterium]|nr:RnfABCDGE type electron transport complex subunit D [Elusimicrobiota bacterium]
MSDRLSLPEDPRWFQIVFLGTLLTVGLLRMGFMITPWQIAGVFAAGLLTQLVFLSAYKLEGVGLKSAIITCLGLSFLLRSDTLWVHPLAAALAMASKFVLRARGKHLWNPANFGVVVSLLLTGHAWVSPAQWGHDLLFAAWFVILGATVVWRAARSDVSWAFLACYLGLCLLRVTYLGQRTAVFWHQFENGSLLLFTFFMISDPRTIPDSRLGRFLLAAAVALFVFTRQYEFFRTNGLFYALFALSPASPFVDRWLAGAKHFWTKADGAQHEAIVSGGIS